MPELSTHPTAAAIIEFFQDRHRELAKQAEGIGDTGVNWRPAPQTNSVFELLNHGLDAERGCLNTISGAQQTFERRQPMPGTEALALARIQQADADLLTFLGGDIVIDVEQEVQYYRRAMPTMLAIALGVGHVNEHLGHVQMTRQLWDEFGKTGVLAGWEREPTPAG